MKSSALVRAIRLILYDIILHLIYPCCIQWSAKYGPRPYSLSKLYTAASGTSTHSNRDVRAS